MAYFPKMQGGDFPHIDNVNVNQWTNEFDYSRYDALQMKLTICAVPWDMGEAHIGNRTISGIGNVVWFETKAKRDEWFAAIPDNKCYRFETKYKDLPHDGYIDVPLPFDIASKFNYIMQEFEPFANDESYIRYEDADGHRKWFWFIREVEYLAPNTTRLHILDDAFQTWMYDVNISGMILERGHAPLFETKADDFLDDPIGNCRNLLTEDVNFGSSYIARSSSEFVFNTGNMYALIVTTANVYNGVWGTKANSDWKTPGFDIAYMQGVAPSYYAFVVDAGDFNTFINNVQSDYPQFVQTIKAIAFVSENMFTLGRKFLFASVTCCEVEATYKDYYHRDTLINLNESMFAYPDEYKGIAKLYTFPYSYILVTNEKGDQIEVHIEDTSGTIHIERSLSLVFPWLKTDAHLAGIGSAARKQISFTNISTRNMPIQGNWYEYLIEWDIPTFGIYQNAGTNNDYSTFYDRVQQQYAINNQYDNVVESADCLVDNADLTAATNTALVNNSNSSADRELDYTILYNNSVAGVDNDVIRDTATSTIAANQQQGSLAASSSFMSQVAGSIGGVARGDVAGTVGNMANALIGANQTLASTSIANGLTSSQASIAQDSNNNHATVATANSRNKVNNQKRTQSDAAPIQNDLTTGSAANTAAMQIANGARDKATGESGIANQINQAAMNAPNEFGAWNAGQTATTRPMALFANIVTQNDSAISAAGDEMLRYGYMFGKQWPFDGNWNIGKHFTYWKLRDFWVRSLNVPDMYMDRLRFFLFGGVTVWRRPEDIGNYSIYENGV